MKTHCNQKTFDFQTQNSRKIVAHFNGGNITSDEEFIRKPPTTFGTIQKFGLVQKRLILGYSSESGSTAAEHWE